MAPAWWSSGYNNGIPTAIGRAPGPRRAPVDASGGVQAFEYFFHRLTEPYPGRRRADSSGTAAATYGCRRAFYSKFLILSGGLDKQLGRLPLLRCRLCSQLGEQRGPRR